MPTFKTRGEFVNSLWDTAGDSAQQSLGMVLQKQQQDKQLKDMLQKLVLENSLKGMRLKQGSNVADMGLPREMQGVLGNFEPDPMAQLERQAGIADAENKIYQAGGPAPSFSRKGLGQQTQPVDIVRGDMPILGQGSLVPKGYDQFGRPTGFINPKQELIDLENKAKIQDKYRPANATEETSALYANRMEQAESVFNKLNDELNSLGLGSAVMQAKLGPLGVPNWAKTSEAQSYEQARRNFLSAVLRKESGAVISANEIAEGNQQYFPQPWDKPEVIAQKAENRKVAIEGLKRSGGKAYTPWTGGIAKTTNFNSVQDAEQANLPKGTIIYVNGKKAVVE